MKYKFDAKKFKRNFKRDWQLHLYMAVPVIYLIIFDFIPMYGLQIAFRDFRPTTGITHSEWVGLKWFKDFVSSPDFPLIFGNTIKLSLYDLCTFPLPICFALVVHALRGEKYKKVFQTISYMPHFISTAVMIGIVNMLLSPVSGLYGNIYRFLGGSRYPLDFRATAAAFPHIFIWSGIWQSLGWMAVIYIAALSSVPQELHEAAEIDGASRLKRMWYIDLPAIIPTVAMMLIMRCTSLIAVGFEKVYLMQSELNLTVSEVIATYTFKKGLSSFRSYSYGAAVGLFNTVINLTILVVVNEIVKKATDGDICLF